MAALFAELTAGRPVHLAVHHADALADAEALVEAARAASDIVEAHVTEFTQVMGVHTGPGLVGMAWWCE